jgi:nucleoid-associated protein YgaU
MSFTDRLVLWLHIGFAIFTIGPVTVAIMSTPRYIRKRNLVIVRYLYRTTTIFAMVSLGVLVFGLVLASLKKDFSKPWLTVSLTLFVVALVLLALIIRDQHRAIGAMEDADATAAEAAAEAQAAQIQAAQTQAAQAQAARASETQAAPAQAAAAAPGAPAAGTAAGTATGEPAAALPGPPVTAGTHLGHVERGRVATMGGVVSLIWLVILVLMVWNG